MKLILSHPTANANVRAVAIGLSKAGVLEKFHTSIASFPGDALDRLSHFKGFAELRRRRFDPALKPFTATWPWREIGRLISMKAGLNRLLRDEEGIFCIDAVYNGLDKHVASLLNEKTKKDAFAVYAYEDCALDTFTKAKKTGLKCIYDLPIAFWETGRRLLSEEADRIPVWKRTLGGGIEDSKRKLDRKTCEMELADMVIVPSEFVLHSMPSWAKTKFVHMAPFGSPVMNSISGEHQSLNTRESRRLRVLFVGSMGQRKGLGDLFKAMRLLNNPAVELIVMGSLLAPIEFYQQEFPHFTYEPGRPNEKVLELMRSCDVFCLPSIVEGRALVIQEAMSQGLPVIITPNTGGEDLIIEGKTGFLVPIRSPEVIAEKLTWLIENKEKIPEMGAMAKKHASQYTWDNYSSGIIHAIKTSFVLPA